ncbi:hypothetical protein B0H13DRAFT_2460922 [Mycena leptocephala]|nr:hypothetical protein B0H13DRAFT_2460922 [Mycena leptocephala]
MPLSDAQLSAVLEAKRLLASVGLTTTNLDTNDRDLQEVTNIIASALPTTSAALLYRNYVHALVDHPVGSIVEYPETGASKGVGIAHKFSVDPENFCHPKESFQYSLGDSHGGEPYVHCGTLLLGLDGTPASCFHKKWSCKGLKYCSARSLPSSPLPAFRLDSLAEAKKEIFAKTLGFYCTLAEKGCAFDLGTDGEDICSTGLTDNADLDPESESDTSDSDSELDGEPDSKTRTKIINDCRRKKSSRSLCKGRLELRLDEYGRSFVQCERRNKTNKAHLILRTLDEFDIPYLRALLENDSRAIDEHEELARQFGYGPRVPCAFSASPSAQKELCPKTPPALLETFKSLLLDLDWKLADATPRKLMIDSGFMGSLRRALGWNKPFDPPLAALHPSLGNLDHVRRILMSSDMFYFLRVQASKVGAQLLATEHRKLPPDEQRQNFSFGYLYVAVHVQIAHALEKTLLGYAFKRLNGKWQEFEMETWELNGMKSVIGTRAFTTSQSTEAHVILFTRIFEIAFEDTGIPCRFRHIHGEGFELWITDSHKGQALGAGKFCQNLCAQLGDVYCPIEPTRLLRTLDPYDHLRRFLRFCTTHYIRNVDKLKPCITWKVRRAMLSLSSSQTHPDLDGAFQIIENGGRKAKAWLKDKRIGSKFAIPALYQPASLIPLEIWKSAPSTTNGNEQAHRNINRDGVNLTMLGGIMRGMQYDARAMEALELHSSQGIYSRDQTATHFRRLQRSLNRHGNAYSSVLVQTRVAARNTLENEENGLAPSQFESAVGRNAADAQRTNHARLGNAIPLFTTTPLAPVENPLQPGSLPPPSWLDQQMCIDIPGVHMPMDVPSTWSQPSNHCDARPPFESDISIPPQINFASSSSDCYNPYNNDDFSRDSLDQYLATYGVPAYPLDPTAFDTQIPHDDTSYLHLPQPYNLPQAPEYPHQPFAHFNF